MASATSFFAGSRDKNFFGECGCFGYGMSLSTGGYSEYFSGENECFSYGVSLFIGGLDKNFSSEWDGSATVLPSVVSLFVTMPASSFKLAAAASATAACYLASALLFAQLGAPQALQTQASHVARSLSRTSAALGGTGSALLIDNVQVNFMLQPVRLALHRILPRSARAHVFWLLLVSEVLNKVASHASQTYFSSIIMVVCL